MKVCFLPHAPTLVTAEIHLEVESDLVCPDHPFLFSDLQKIVFTSFLRAHEPIAFVLHK